MARINHAISDFKNPYFYLIFCYSIEWFGNTIVLLLSGALYNVLSILIDINKHYTCFLLEID